MSNIIVPFGKPFIDNSELNSIKKVLKSGKYVHGKETESFEKIFKKFTKSKNATTVSSCTAGMHLFYLALGISKGDEVLVPAQTHVATSHAVEIVGAKPIFVDCELETGNIDVNKIEKKITARTKAIVVVHFLGIPVKMQKILKIAKKNKLKVLEDCALALGAKIGDKHVGTFGDAGVFSFYPVKHITTAEGGMIVSNNKKLDNIIRSKKAFGVDKNYNQRNSPGKYDVRELGINYRMSEIHATMGVAQMKKLKEILKKRKYNFDYLSKDLAKIKQIQILKNTEKKIYSSNYCLSFILNKKLASKRSKLIKLLNGAGVGTSIYYPKPVPLMRYYKNKYNYKKNFFKNAFIISENSIAIPTGPHLKKRDLKFIVNEIFKSINALN